MAQQEFEKLGAFYLGKRFDPVANQVTEDLILYDSKDLVTHALIVGMTGSGKTGLGIGLLEEAAIDGVPAIVIDPKGDLANLMLNFPELRPTDFEPWINPDDAVRKNLSVGDFAAEQAATWKDGLAKWGQDGERIRKMGDAAEVVIYTPGSNAGLPVSILKSFGAPPPAIVEDEELLGERVSTTVTSLLGLLGIDADPLNSREHILISTILDRSWRDGTGLDLAGLIQQIQTPPVTQIGVMQMDSFFPSKDRFVLSTSINNLLAAPRFQGWLQGEALDIGNCLHTPAGKPKISIFSIAHLNDSERMFFVTLLLSEILGWTRSQPGTTSLRAIVYMDEIAGYFPPVANPPSKAPLLTLLKQARAFGVGVVLATQNPVDLDYKGMSNAGTWFIGRLQTERDKSRLMEGLESLSAVAGTAFDPASIDKMISGLQKRVFLMNNVHEDGPEVFQTRWTLSYLAGPATRAQIKQLMDGKRGAAGVPAVASPGPETEAPQAAAAATPQRAPAAASERPLLPPEVPAFYLPVRARGAGLTYLPTVFGAAEVRFQDAKSGVSTTTEIALVVEHAGIAVPMDWDLGGPAEFDPSILETQPEQGASFAPLPEGAGKEASYPRWSKDLAAWAYSSQTVDVLKSPVTGKTSTPGESEADFRARLAQDGREKRDARSDDLRKKYAVKEASLQDRLRRAQQAVEREAGQAKQAKMQTAISLGTTVLGAFLGRKRIGVGTLGRATSAVRGAGRAAQQSQDVDRAEENVEAVSRQLADLDAEFQAEVAALEAAADPLTEALETVSIRPKKADITVKKVALVWAPHNKDSAGGPIRAW